MTKFTEDRLEEAIIELIEKENIYEFKADKINRSLTDVLIKDDLSRYLRNKYKDKKITNLEIDEVIQFIQSLASNNLYKSNKEFFKILNEGITIRREKARDLYIQLIDFLNIKINNFKVVKQLEIIGYEKRIPDLILYVNGLPIVLFEFKSAIRKNATIYDAYKQLKIRYSRDIPDLLKYNAFCVISDGINNKIGSIFSNYEFFYSWRRIKENETLDFNQDTLISLIKGIISPKRLLNIIQNFIFFPDTSDKKQKIICRYPQYYASKNIYKNILKNIKPKGSGKGGTYFGATGCGKSYTMLFLSRLLMQSTELKNPTIVLITDRNDLDDQLTETFVNAKTFIGDENIKNIEKRDRLRKELKDRSSGGIFVTTIQKFSEDLKKLSDRSNIICISDEAHRTQLNLDQKIKISKSKVKTTYGFAKYLHDSFPNATYVGFTGTPIDQTLSVFGNIVDTYTMQESVKDEITVPITYEARVAKVLSDKSKIAEIEKYYDKCADEGANEYAINESKNAVTQINTILGDKDRIKDVARDFVNHYEKRCEEGASINNKVMFVSNSRENAYKLYKEIVSFRPNWKTEKLLNSDKNYPKSKKIEKIKLIMTRNKDDEKNLYNLVGNKKNRKKLDKEFKKENSNFKIAIVVDMWLTGFDVPDLDAIYIDKPIKKHNLIQTISRVNRKYSYKRKGLVIDYIGIKKQMNLALKKYSKSDQINFEEIKKSILLFKKFLNELSIYFQYIDTSDYFKGSPLKQLFCLKKSSEHIQSSKKNENNFMNLVKRLKASYDVCGGSDEITQNERSKFYFYLAVRTIIFKLVKGEAPDISEMNNKVKKMVDDAIYSDGVEELFKISENKSKKIDLFDENYLNKIDKIKLPNTKFKVLQNLVTRNLDEYKKVNKIKGVNFTNKLNRLLDKYNDRKEEDVLRSEIINEFTKEILDLHNSINQDKGTHKILNIDVEEKSYYDILKFLTEKYDFAYPEDKLIKLSKKIKIIIDEKTKLTDWSLREDIKAELKADLTILLAENGYPPITHDEVYKEIFEQAQNYKSVLI